jgi:outer membrane murein-binding lipoprotein Lpp
VNKMVRIAGVVFMAFLLAGCQSTEKDAVDTDVKQVDETAKEEVETTEQMDTETDEGKTKDEAAPYETVNVTPDYFIETDTYDTGREFLTMFTIKRDNGKDQNREERLAASLMENDPSEQKILESYTKLTVEGQNLRVDFQEDGNLLSATSAQHSMFYDSLFGISHLYGIEEITFVNPEGEENITVAERKVDAPIVVADERGRSKGYYTLYDKEEKQTWFIPAGELDEGAGGEDLSFQETIEMMQTVGQEDAFYASAITEGLEVKEVSLEDGVAIVHYTMDEEEASVSDRIVFENAMQLVALDFDATELQLVNETKLQSKTFPFKEQ